MIRNRLRAERLRLGLTQSKLGKRAKVATSDVSRIETGRLTPYPRQLARLARVLGVQPEELLLPVDDHNEPRA